MITQNGMNNLKEETFGTLEDYTASFYRFLDADLTDDNKEALVPFIADAHEKGIPTIRLVEIVSSSMS